MNNFFSVVLNESQEESQDGGAARDMKCSSGRSKRAATRARKDDKGKEVAAGTSCVLWKKVCAASSEVSENTLGLFPD